MKLIVRTFIILSLLLGARALLGSGVQSPRRQFSRPAGGTLARTNDFIGGIEQPFAIADFDGDRLPDFATVEADSNYGLEITRYWVQLRASASRPHPVAVLAPTGGLAIQARDVNGDDAVDIVLATAWSQKPVAILLNDGHGGFYRAEPQAFPEAFRPSRVNWQRIASLTEPAVAAQEPQGGASAAVTSSDSIPARSTATRASELPA